LFFVPEWSFFPKTVLPLLETLLIAIWGTILAVVVSVPIAYLAARNITPLPWITYPLGRGLIVLSRSTHEIIFALIYVSALGLGPLPGILALATRSVGFLAKTTAEAIENANPGPIEAIEATGANRVMVFCFGVIPQIYPILVGNVIFQLDINIRRASILGLVGGGGIGLMFAEVMQNLQYSRAGIIVVGITGMVVIGEFISNRIRQRLI
jgi:phosphonate transport system permease protein